ncbi:MAG: peptidylprolyl isomerase [Nitrososphaerota archaeon]|jgi:cyclophilin family peptidyl-prolyl cis-trans isomerase|nr:peptidylprolyl isomerase [Nitrososphaerota archaeon]
MAPKNRHKKQIQNKAKSTKSKPKKVGHALLLGVFVVVLITIIAGAYFTGVFDSNPPIAGDKILLHTSMGDITIQLFDDKPITTQNFLNLVDSGKYDGTIFHRVIKDFMIQGGVINENLKPIKDEIGSNNHNYQYTISMAKMPSANSATSSFFINTVNNSNANFDATYTAFGIVIEGQDVVDAIANVPVEYNRDFDEVSQPSQTITLISATIIS